MKLKFKQVCNLILFWSKQIFYLLFALSLITGLYYLRIIPRASRNLWEHMNYSQIIITIISITLLLLHIYNILKLLGYIQEKSPNSMYIFNRWFVKLQNFIIDILHNFYLFFWHCTELVITKLTGRKYLIHYSIIRLLAQKFNKKQYFKYYCWILISLLYMPKFLFVIAFFIDVIIYNQLHYIFKFLPLLLLPLVEKLIIFIFQEFYDTNYDGVSSFVEKKPIIDSEQIDYSFIPKYKETPPEFVKDFNDFFFNHYIVINELRENLNYYGYWKYNIFPAYGIDFMLLVIRLLIFVYILIYGLV